MYGSLIPCKISVTFKIYSTRFSLFSFKRNISFKNKTTCRRCFQFVENRNQLIHKFSFLYRFFTSNLVKHQQLVNFRKTTIHSVKLTKQLNFFIFFLKINTHIYVSKNISLFEPIEQQKLSIMCELLNDVTMITARAYCLTVALL